jgi:tetratricopeptide (TPR) repeat protein
VLIHNLAVSLEEIERRSPGACKETYLPFALAYYQIKDYPSASRFFERVPDANVRGVVRYNRSYAYYSAGGRDAAAIRGLRTYLLTSPPQPMRAASQVLLGRMLNRGGQKAAAAGEFGMALALLPEGSWLRAVSANDLAYIYSELFAQSEDSLRAAVLLADQALRFTPQQAAWIDTKGWLLYLLKDCNEAERLLSLAAAKAPSNRTIGAHLKQVRTERTGRCRG